MLEKYFFLIILKTRNDSIPHICEPGSTLNGKILRFSGQTHICVKLNTATRTHQEDIVTGQRSKNQIENQTILFPFFTHCKYWPMLRNAFLIHLNFNINFFSIHDLKSGSISVYSLHTIICHNQSNAALVYMRIKYYFWGILPTSKISVAKSLGPALQPESYFGT